MKNNNILLGVKKEVENKLKKLNNLKIKTINNFDGIVFNQNIQLSGYHEADCCEDVYADFENMQVLSKIGKNSINTNELTFSGLGIISSLKLQDGVGFSFKSDEGIELFVSCYNIQNGYYDDNLTLCLELNGDILYERDITQCTQFMEI